MVHQTETEEILPTIFRSRHLWLTHQTIVLLYNLKSGRSKYSPMSYM